MDWNSNRENKLIFKSAQSDKDRADFIFYRKVPL